MFIKRILLLSVVIAFGSFFSPSYAGDIISCDSFENCPDGSVPLTNALLALQARMDALEAENAALKTLLAGAKRGTDPNTGVDTLTFTNMNVQIVNGSGTTEGIVTGTGNLIIGYNAPRAEGGDVRTGSHMLVIGSQNNYSSYGGMVVGYFNETSSRYASVSGGLQGTASGQYASISGGLNNTASGIFASVSGGYGATASGDTASISGGYLATASGPYASISGGYRATASGDAASVSGGETKTATAQFCIVGDDGVDC